MLFWTFKTYFSRYFFYPNNVGANLVVIERPKKKYLAEIITVLENNDELKFNAFVEKITHTINYRYDEYEVKLSLFVYNIDSPVKVVAQSMDE